MISDVMYVTGINLQQALRKISKYTERTILIEELIKAYGLFSKLTVVESQPASEDEIRTFHSEAYIDFVKKAENESLEGCEDLVDEGEEFGLGYDCPIFPNMFTAICELAGASLSGAKLLNKKKCKIAINWAGGWHHAKKDEAAGFCYVNDIVLAITELRKEFEKVLYLDFDLHHGDGVEEAFAYTSKVFCLSIHKHSAGFYPGTGGLDSAGSGSGKYHTVNIPLKDGIQDEQYCNLVCKLLEDVFSKYNPDCVVCQFGVDGLYGDPMRCFNLSLQSYGTCLKTVLNWNKPSLILGGGGYNPANVARCWAFLTSLIVEEELSNEIPDHKYLLAYGPDYELNIIPGKRIDFNKQEELDEILRKITSNLQAIYDASE